MLFTDTTVEFIRADFVPPPNTYGASTDTVDVDVGLDTATIDLVPDIPSPVPYGARNLLTAGLIHSSGAGLVPTGTVTFSVDGRVVCRSPSRPTAHRLVTSPAPAARAS